MQYQEALRIQSREPDVLQPQPGLPSAACLVDEAIIDNTLSLRMHRQDTSFVRQFHDIVHNFRTIDESLDGPPEIFLFTAYSAIPFADMLRGYHQAAGSKCPAIGYVKASAKKWRSSDEIADEVERLRDTVGDMTHVCIIEEYSSTGRTLDIARKLLQNAGALGITAIRGRWDPMGIEDPARVDLDAIAHSSDHTRTQLTEIGMAAYMLHGAEHSSS